MTVWTRLRRKRDFSAVQDLSEPNDAVNIFDSESGLQDPKS